MSGALFVFFAICDNKNKMRGQAIMDFVVRCIIAKALSPSTTSTRAPADNKDNANNAHTEKRPVGLLNDFAKPCFEEPLCCRSLNHMCMCGKTSSPKDCQAIYHRCICDTVLKASLLTGH
jgi:hypothetical protein